ncbi:MAG: hypothetical protein PHV68_06170 [Candidatus Gastranaerophilales bacterium]|nr:hypothetical protein [Candidatus Gastranaerophilales bacterium]
MSITPVSNKDPFAKFIKPAEASSQSNPAAPSISSESTDDSSTSKSYLPKALLALAAIGAGVIIHKKLKTGKEAKALKEAGEKAVKEIIEKFEKAANKSTGEKLLTKLENGNFQNAKTGKIYQIIAENGKAKTKLFDGTITAKFDGKEYKKVVKEGKVESNEFDALKKIITDKKVAAANTPSAPATPDPANA